MNPSEIDELCEAFICSNAVLSVKDGEVSVTCLADESACEPEVSCGVCSFVGMSYIIGWISDCTDDTSHSAEKEDAGEHE